MGTLAIPNGSLYDATVAMLASIGKTLIFNGNRNMPKISGSDLFRRALIVRPQAIPELILKNKADCGICGFDWVAESGALKDLKIVKEYDYSKTTQHPVDVVVVGKTDQIVDTPETLVYAEYPNLARQIFRQAKIVFSPGTTEVLIALGLYNYGVCVTETGSSIRENNLIIVKKILTSHTVLVAKPNQVKATLFDEMLSSQKK